MNAAATVLVVDDDARNRALVSGYLRGGFNIVEAASGPEALELAARQPVDLVLLDVMMPGMSGYDVCRALKRRAGGEVLPVLLVTALSEQVDRNTGLDAGADDFLAKPIDRHELRMRVNAFLRLREQDQLLHRQLEELRHLDALKDDLVSLMVHDLRSPLAGVIALLDVLHTGLSDPQQKEDVGLAMAGASRIRDALEDVLHVRMLEEDRLAPELHLHRVDEVIREAIRSVQPSARRARVELACACPPELSFAFDRKLVGRAVENLLTNAVKYSPTRETVEVSARALDGGVVIEVSDRGPGVPESLRGALFEKFGSVEVASRRSRRGHGFGLYLVKLVACAHGGRPVVAGREGGGSVFGLWLPLREAP